MRKTLADNWSYKNAIVFLKDENTWWLQTTKANTSAKDMQQISPFGADLIIKKINLKPCEFESRVEYRKLKDLKRELKTKQSHKSKIKISLAKVENIIINIQKCLESIKI